MPFLSSFVTLYKIIRNKIKKKRDAKTCVCNTSLGTEIFLQIIHVYVYGKICVDWQDIRTEIIAIVDRIDVSLFTKDSHLIIFS